LEQIVDDNKRPVVFASRATNDAEKKYPPTKLEMTAIIFALNHFEVYLLSHKIIIFTDHQALVTGYLSYLKGQSRGLLSRWYFKVTCQTLPSSTNHNEAADALSHTPVSTEEGLGRVVLQNRT